jgi:hypothetical protein
MSIRVSFLDLGHNCSAQVNDMETGEQLFEIYSDYLHYHGYKKIENKPYTNPTYKKVATFEKDDEVRRVVLYVIEQ